MKNILLLFLLLYTHLNLYSDYISFRALKGEGIGYVFSIVENEQGYLFVNSDKIGIVRSTDNGKTWVHFDNGLPENSVYKIIVGFDGKIIVSTVGAGLYTSTDNGISWSQLKNELSDQYITEFLVHKTGYYFAGSYYDSVGLRRSTNQGLSWEKIDSTFKSIYISGLISNSNGDLFTVVNPGKIFRSSDLGDSWALIQNDSTNIKITAICHALNNDIIVGTDKRGTYLIRFGSDKMVILNNDLKDKELITINVDSTGNIYAGLQDGIYLLDKDYGKWSKIYDSITVNEMYISPRNEKLIGSRGKLSLYDEIEKKWKNLNNTIFLNNKKVSSILPKKNGQLVIGTQNDGLFFLQSENNIVEKRDSGLASGKVDVLFERNANEIFAYIDSIGIYYSDDTCHNWKLFNKGLENHIVKTFLSLNNGDLLTSTNDGIFINHQDDSVWNESSSGLTDKNINCMLLIEDNQILAGSEYGKVYKSDNNGTSWIETGTLPKNNKPATSLVVNSKGIIFAGTSGYGIYRSNDNGVTWKKVNFGISDYTINSLIVTKDDDLLAATPSVIFYSSIDGDYWIRNDNENINPFVYHNGKIYAGSKYNELIVCDSIVRTINQSKGGWVNKNRYLEQTLKVGDITYIKYSNDGKSLYTFGVDTIFRKWDVETGNVLEEYPLNNYYEITDIDFDENSNLLAIANSTWYYSKIEIYDISKDSVLFIIEPGDDYSPPIQGYSTPKVAFDIINNKIYTGVAVHRTWGGDGGVDGKIDSWDLQTGSHIKEYSELDYAPYWLIFSPDHNNLFYSGYHDFYFSEGHGGEEYHYYKSYVINSIDSAYELNSRIRQLAVSPNQKYFAASTDSSNEIILYDYNTNNVIRSWSNGRSYYCPVSLVFSKNEKFLVSSSAVSGESRFIDNEAKNYLRIWQVETGQLLDSIEFPDYQYLILAASPDSLSIAAATSVGYIPGMDGLIRIINPKIITQKLKSFFVVDSNAKLKGSTIHFRDSSIGNLVSWYWDFGDGSTSTEQNPSHLYADTGSYDITFICTDGTNTDTLYKKEYIHITSPLIADFDASPTTGVYPLTVKFINKSIGIPKYFEWSYNANIISSDTNPEYIFEGYGNYIIKMVISDGYFCDSTLKEVNVLREQFKNPVFFEKYYYNNIHDVGYKVIECKEGGFTISGICTTYSGSIDDIVYEYNSEIYHTDNDGNFLWLKNILYGEKVTQLYDGCYLLLGQKYNQYNINYDYNFMIKTSPNGDSLWSKSIENPDSSYAMDITSVSDGFLLIGSSSNGDSSTFITKYENNGNIKWTKKFPGNGGKILGPYDDGYLIVTISDKTIINIIKTDTDFNTEWISSTSEFKGHYIYDYTLMNNGNIIFSGSDENRIARYILMLDTSCSVMWNKNILFYCNSITKLDDTLFAAICNDYKKMGIVIFDNYGNVKKEINFAGREGSFEYIDVTKNKELILTGTAKGSTGIENIYFVKTLPYDILLSINDNTEYKSDSSLYVYPNPADKQFTVSFYLDYDTNVKIKLFNAYGAEIGELLNDYLIKGNHGIIYQSDFLELSSGIYFIQLIENGKSIVTKLILTR
ncbi:MAG: PKD domain-containing protein [Ignavibacteriae bacterium]|nr:PKD domain-containing protein [Ignavibacteriota bacterium]